MKKVILTFLITLGLGTTLSGCSSPEEKAEKYYQKGMALIEKELGIPAGDWQKQEMVVIEIANPNAHNLRMATGREEGANDLWLAGGKLPTGHDEAVTDAIPKGAYKEMNLKEATENARKKI